jgi:hypothetical protein
LILTSETDEGERERSGRTVTETAMEDGGSTFKSEGEESRDMNRSGRGLINYEINSYLVFIPETI